MTAVIVRPLDRIAEIKTRIAAAEKRIADRSLPIEQRLAEKRAVNSWRTSLLVLGSQQPELVR